MIKAIATAALRGRHVLILEDDVYTAADLAREVGASGGIVVGPFRDVADSLRAVDAALPDAALVDLNLGDGRDLTLPAKLRERNVPFVFVTGYGASSIPEAFTDVPRLEKPASAEQAVQLLSRLVAGD